MKKVLQMIQDGTFNKEWITEYQKNGQESFAKFMKETENHQIEKVGKQKRHLVGDSIEGWADAVKALMQAYFFGERLPRFDFSDYWPAILIAIGISLLLKAKS